ncbi:MAG: UDP-N-acetylmuramoyl-tripeptide--D-alanyl-D-alanine ligase [Pyrinomonadaceae bacterium]|nr:UDP-N-acetylmuramoyl-tripeptide--D-alanyl-D-alanine ligase [Pyrinomonadaceae bacterium]
MKLKTAIEYTGADTSNLSPALLETEVTSFAIDSREVKAGNVFFALSQPEYKNNGFNGEFEDSTKFVPSAFENGAVACVVRRDRFEENRAALEQFEDRLVFTDDAILALQNLAHGVYARWNRPVVAITGSAGKTTAKELTAFVLEAAGKNVLRNIKNYNNGLGHPLTVLNLAKYHDFDIAVLEMGMSTPMREIARLCEITPPDVAVALNVLPVHLEHLGSIERIAKAKAELVEGMKTGGTAVLNSDDERVLAMRQLSKGSVLTYGIVNDSDVMAKDIEVEQFGETKFRLITPRDEAQVSIQLSGRHNVMNALAAAAVGHHFGMTAKEIAKALGNIRPISQRGEILHFREGFTVINDSYNSNPSALLSVIESMKSAGTAARKIVVAGEMLELGGAEREIHRKTGREIAEQGIDLLIGVRGLAKEMVDGALENGLPDARFFDDSESAGEFLAGEIRSGDLILVKGSRGVKTEKVVEKIVQKFKPGESLDASAT